jgi:DNA primase
MISKSTIERIKTVSRIEDFCTDVKKAYGANRVYCECPACKYINDKKKQGLSIDTKKNIAKCFSCGIGYGGAIDFVMKTTNANYPDALIYIAKQYGIFIEETAGSTGSPTAKGKKTKPTTPAIPKHETRNPEPDPDPDPAPEEKPGLEKKAGKKTRQPEGQPVTRNPQPGHTSFCDTQLSESGLTYDDIRIETTDPDGTVRYISPFVQGTRDQYQNNVEQKGDDVLIKYYDLDAKPVMYKPEKSNIMRPLIRVRWQNPAAHTDKDGEPIKYQSPAKSGSHIYIPEALRRMYKHARKVKRLYLQEGEKKAEKACKHGIMSVGIMGINNLGSDGRLPDEIQLIVQRCNVEEVIFVIDSDWRNLSENLKNGQAVDTRPRQFFAAVRSFKEYLRTLANLDCSVEIYFGYIKFNDAKAKGIDDLLCTVLATKETELADDFDFAVNDKSGSGQFVQVNKITMLPDDKIADFWLLNDAEKFAETHKHRLKDLKEFKIRGLLRKFSETGKLEMAQQLFAEEQFWDEQEKTARDGEIRKTLVFDYVNAMNFLQRRGFFRYKMISGDKILIYIENKVIYTIDHTDIKDYVKNFCREIKRLDVLNMLMRGGPQYLGPEKLSNLDLNRPNIERALTDTQCLFFRDKIWEITAEGIKEINYGQFSEFVWSEKVIKYNAKALAPMVNVTVLTDELRPKLPEGFDTISNGEFFIDYADYAAKSHFLSFLQNTSNFAWKKPEDKITLDDQFLNSRHLVNKLTAIGYLLHDYKDDNESKAIIAMDAKLSEVGASNGRSGKSLVGVAISHIIPQVVVDGKDKNIDDDKFRYHEVTEKTKNLFFDDVRANFDFESLFQVITGKMTVNQKSGLRFTMRRDDTPKILITTNHAINGMGSSFNDRQAFMAFTDFYNDNHKPVDDFGCAFFSEWDAEQWNLFYNLMATCLMLYFRSKQNGWSGTKRLGIVPPPMEDVEKRKLRQTMGENFLTWADAYFFWDDKLKTGNLNQPHVRKELFDNFLNENPIERKYCNPTRFKEKVKAFCFYNGYDFNPEKRNQKGLDRNQFFKTYPTGCFIGDDDKTGGKEYFTLANKDFNGNF